MKNCCNCGVNKPAEEFYPAKNTSDKLSSWCRQCNFEYRAARKEERRDYDLKRAFGISKEHYDKMFYEHEGCCAICGAHNDTLVKNLAVDHCHTTGNIRGLLCNSCNLGIGMLKDSLDLLQKAVSYLKASNGQTAP